MTETYREIDKYMPDSAHPERVDLSKTTTEALSALLWSISLSPRNYCIEFSLGGVFDEVNSEQLRSARELPGEERQFFFTNKAEELYWAESITIKSSPADKPNEP